MGGGASGSAAHLFVARERIDALGDPDERRHAPSVRARRAPMQAQPG
ncbi:hypothetical protein GGQ82_003825 [Sphingobium olei]